MIEWIKKWNCRIAANEPLYRALRTLLQAIIGTLAALLSDWVATLVIGEELRGALMLVISGVVATLSAAIMNRGKCASTEKTVETQGEEADRYADGD